MSTQVTHIDAMRNHRRDFKERHMQKRYREKQSPHHLSRREQRRRARIEKQGARGIADFVVLKPSCISSSVKRDARMHTKKVLCYLPGKKQKRRTRIKKQVTRDVQKSIVDFVKILVSSKSLRLIIPIAFVLCVILRDKQAFCAFDSPFSWKRYQVGDPDASWDQTMQESRDRVQQKANRKISLPSPPKRRQPSWSGARDETWRVNDPQKGTWDWRKPFRQANAAFAGAVSVAGDAFTYFVYEKPKNFANWFSGLFKKKKYS